MKHVSQGCDDQQLRLLLEAGDDTDRFRDATEHVERCSRCQLRLSHLAADAGAWEEVGRLLAEDPSDAEFAAERSGHIRKNPPGGDGATAWTETMARQLLAPPSHPEMLGRIGRYEVERLIGSGGMGIVFKGFDTELHRPVAIKVLAPHLAGSGAARQRFAREARAAAAVVHEHVVAIHNVESDGATPFLVMQFVAGESLQARLDRQGPLELCEVLRIGRQAAAGLAAAHAQGLVHRDVKPSNILLEHGIERALLTDFGLARAADDANLTHTGNLAGTPHYMSPEQASGEVIDARSDLFSLGSVLYAMATGRPPFRADTSLGILRRITDTQPRPICEVNPDIPPWLYAIVTRLHAKSPADRFSSAHEVATLLEKCLAHVRQPAVARLPEILRRDSFLARMAWPAAIAGMFLLAVTLTVAGLVFMPPARRTNTTEATTADSAKSAAGTSAQAPSPSESDWDSAGRQIESLNAATDALSTEVDQLWKTPTTLPLAPTPETMP